MKRFLFIFSIIAALVSCDDTTDTLGMTLVDVVDTDTTYAESFPVATESVLAEHVVSRVSTGFLGRIKDPETSSYVTCNYMTQLRPLNHTPFPNDTSMFVPADKADKELYDVIEADSCEMVLYFPDFYGDSLALMQVTLHEMAVPYLESETYYTNFDPQAHGMLRNDGKELRIKQSYTLSDRLLDPEDRAKNVPILRVSLNRPYTDKDGVEYKNYGTYLMRKYYNPATRKSFMTQADFNKDICPGFYFQYSGGLGSLQKISVAMLMVYYNYSTSKAKKDTITGCSAFSGTEEVMQRTFVAQDLDKMQALTEDNSCTYLKTPACIYTQATLPVLDIKNQHENDTLSTVRMYLSSLNDQSSSSFHWKVPSTILLVPTDSVEAFFDNKQVADSRTTYLSNYSSQSNGYVFSNISTLVSDMYYKYMKYGNDKAQYIADYRRKNPMATDQQAEEAWLKFLQVWNKVTLIPVETTYSTLSLTSSQVLTKVTYNMDILSTKLAKGTTDKDSKVKVNVIYSKFNTR